MSCLVDNFHGTTAPPVPGLGAFLECNLYDLEPGSGEIIYTLAPDSRPGSWEGESYRFAGASLRFRLQWPAAGTRDRVKVEFLTGRPLETVTAADFFTATATETTAPGTIRATILSRPNPDTDPTAPSILQEFTASASLSVTGARWNRVPAPFGELRYTFDPRFVIFTAASIGSSWEPAIVPAPRLIFEGGHATASDLVFRFRKGWTLYNPGYLQRAF